MNIATKTAIVAALAGVGTIASAASIDLNYTGIVGGSSASHARVGSSTYLAGHMSHTITSGARAGQSFNTFCIEVEEYASSGSATYQIVRLENAPNPGALYGQSKADAVSAIVANAFAMGWIDANLQSTNTSDSQYLAKMGAIQAAIWEALGHDFQENSSSTSADMRTQYNALMSVATFNGSLRMQNLRAVVAEGQQDQLYIIPLPNAAFAGLGMFGLIAGVRVARRR